MDHSVNNEGNDLSVRSDPFVFHRLFLCYIFERISAGFMRYVLDDWQQNTNSGEKEYCFDPNFVKYLSSWKDTDFSGSSVGEANSPFHLNLMPVMLTKYLNGDTFKNTKEQAIEKVDLDAITVYNKQIGLSARGWIEVVLTLTHFRNKVLHGVGESVDPESLLKALVAFNHCILQMLEQCPRGHLQSASEHAGHNKHLHSLWSRYLYLTKEEFRWIASQKTLPGKLDRFETASHKQNLQFSLTTLDLPSTRGNPDIDFVPYYRTFRLASPHPQLFKEGKKDAGTILEKHFNSFWVGSEYLTDHQFRNWQGRLYSHAREELQCSEVGVFALKVGWDKAAGLDNLGVPMWTLPTEVNHCYACVAARDRQITGDNSAPNGIE